MLSKMEFQCKLAHESEIKHVSCFNSIKELYERVSQVFSVPISEIMYCTINTHDFRDMDALLGNYLSLGDLIVVHLCGDTKDLSLTKTEEYLGLTITDNCHGRAFVKKVKSSDPMIERVIKPGDHIAAVNLESTVGMRHYEVAKTIREVPLDTNFTLRLIEPLRLSSGVQNGTTSLKIEGPSESLPKTTTPDISLLTFNDPTKQNTRDRRHDWSSNTSRENPDVANMDSIFDDLVHSSLPIDRLLSKGGDSRNESDKNGANEFSSDSYRSTIDKINTMLESFLGINDNLLAIQIYRLARDNQDSLVSFSKAISNSNLSIFNFGEELETYLWNCATCAE